MEFEVTVEQGYTIIALKGEVDLHYSPVARKQILKYLKDKHNVLVDLSSVEYIDSSGVASLVEGYQLAKENGLDFALVGISDAAKHVLELARLDQIFRIYSTVEDYVNSK